MKAVQKKTKFTSIDIENNLYDLATSVMKKNIDFNRTNAAVNAYRGILTLQALKIKAAKFLPANPATSQTKSLSVK